MLGRGGRRARGARTYGEDVRSFRRFGGGEGFRAESWSLDGAATSFDAEVAAVVRCIEICLMTARPGDSFNIFADSQAAMTRLRDDRVGPGHDRAVRGIRLAKELGDRRRYPFGGSPDMPECEETRLRTCGQQTPQHERKRQGPAVQESADLRGSPVCNGRGRKPMRTTRC